MGVPHRGYVAPSHPVQREVKATLESLSGVAIDDAQCAVDGCSVPTWAMPLRALALGFARFGTGAGLSASRAAAAARLRAACTAQPWMVAGTGRLCTDVMTLCGARVLLKTGAEGVYAAALPEQGLGIAVKCDDGATRAAEIMMAAVVDALLPMSDAERALFAARLTPPIESRVGRKVGEIRPVAGLAESIREGHN